MRKIDLSGEWSLFKGGEKRSNSAYVPGCVHGSLFDAGVIKEPFSGQNLAEMEKVLQSAWSYEKIFVAEDLSAYDQVVVCFGGFTAAAEISLNNKKVATTNERFSAVEFSVKDFIRAGKNSLVVKFSPLTKATRGAAWNEEGVPLIAESFGIWGDVSVQAYAQVRISDVRIEMELAPATAAAVSVQVEVERFSSVNALEIMARICYKGNILSERRALLSDSPQKIALEVKNPQLWWPAAMGDQPLYEVTVDILEGRTCLDHVAKRVGLRQFEMQEEAFEGRTVQRFYVNGKSMLVKGAEWVPADLYVAQLTRVEYAHLVKSAVIANINFLRIGAGGVYENECFYNLCDEYGLCVWQDVMTSAAKEELIVHELSEAVKRLRHHPSLSVWYGGTLDGLKRRSKEQCEKVIREGGADLVWLPEKPADLAFVNYGEGTPVFPSSPEPCKASRYLSVHERNIGHPASRFHLSHQDDLKTMYNGFAETFQMPVGFENVLWLSQIQHGLRVKWAIEQQRMRGGMETGFVFRRLNEGWPCCSPSALDYYGSWKALHYMTRRFFAGYSVCGEYDPAGRQADLYAFNDNHKPFKGEVCWSVALMDGTVATEGSRKVSVAAASGSKPVRVNVAELFTAHAASEMVMWIYLNDDQGNKVSWNVVLFCNPWELDLHPPRMRAEIRNFDENSYVVTLTSQTPAMWAWVTLEGIDAIFSDNFFCMEPAKPFSVKITPKTRIKLDQFRQCFRIGSLRDTWQERGGLMQMRAGPAKKR